MKKTIPITIAGQLFYIEEDAYEKLNGYLASIKSHFAETPERDEIVSDIENRIAEHFSESSKSPDKIVTLGQVENIVASMGNAEDFGDDQPQDKKNKIPEPPVRKRLYRNPDDVIIAGVCSGIAAYFEMDPLLVRLLWVATLFLGGGGILAYIIFWIIMPEAKTAGDKLEMRGQPVTVESVSEMVKERISEVKKNGALRKLAAFPVTVLRAIVKTLGPVIGGIIGTVLTVAAAAGIFFVSFAALNLLFNAGGQYVDFPARNLITAPEYYGSLAAGSFSALIPLIVLLLLGLTIAGRKNYFAKSAVLVLVGLWFISLLAAGTLALRIAPEVRAKMAQNPNFQPTQFSYEIKDFTAISAAGASRVTVEQDAQYSVKAIGSPFDLQNLNVHADNGTLFIGQRSLSRPRICLFCGFSRPKVEVTMPSVESLNASGASTISAKGFSVPAMAILDSGASATTWDGDAVNLIIKNSGASTTSASGTGDSLDITLSGSSRMDASEFQAAHVNVKASGASRAQISPAQTLNVDASGASRVLYAGSPVITQHLSGASKLIQELSESRWDEWAPDAPLPPNPDMQ